MIGAVLKSLPAEALDGPLDVEQREAAKRVFAWMMRMLFLRAMEGQPITRELCAYVDMQIAGLAEFALPEERTFH
jgi:hypothetical protein